MKIAIVHDWLTQFSGAERVLRQLHLMYPEAPIYTIDYKDEVKDRVVPNAKVIKLKRKRLLSILIPSAIESLDLSEFDVVISSSAIFSKAIITRPKARHICYCYSPSRQLWDNDKSRNVFRHIARIWDRVASIRPDEYVAISEHVRKRILKYYRRDSVVVYPPVEDLSMEYPIKSEDMDLMRWKDSYYLIVSRLIPSKNIELAVEAFNKSGRRLVIIGDGPLLSKLKEMTKDNVTVLGSVSDNELSKFYRESKAFVMPQEEDFGIATIEAMKYGKPVLALRRGSALEIIKEGISGVFFEDPIVESLGRGINIMEETYLHFNGKEISESVEKFSALRFREEFNKIVTR